MATTSVLKFMLTTADNDRVQAQLEELLGVGDGDISSAKMLDSEESAALKGQRGPLVTEFAAQNGFDFSVQELSTVVDAFEKFQAGSINEPEFESIVGMAIPPEKSPVQKVMKFLSKTYLGY